MKPFDPTKDSLSTSPVSLVVGMSAKLCSVSADRVGGGDGWSDGRPDHSSLRSH